MKARLLILFCLIGIFGYSQTPTQIDGVRIFLNKADTSLWYYSPSTGYRKVGTGSGGSSFAFGNGLTLNGINVGLGGALTANTNITGRNYNLSLGTSANRLNGVNLYSKNGIYLEDTLNGSQAASLNLYGGDVTLFGRDIYLQSYNGEEVASDTNNIKLLGVEDETGRVRQVYWNSGVKNTISGFNIIRSGNNLTAIISTPDGTTFTSTWYDSTGTGTGGMSDGNNFPTSLSYSGTTLTLGRNGLANLTATIPQFDSTSLSNRILQKLGISDTSAMLLPYVNIAGFGLIKTTHTLTVDTLSTATRGRLYKAIDSINTLSNKEIFVGTTSQIRALTTVYKQYFDTDNRLLYAQDITDASSSDNGSTVIITNTDVRLKSIVHWAKTGSTISTPYSAVVDGTATINADLYTSYNGLYVGGAAADYNYHMYATAGYLTLRGTLGVRDENLAGGTTTQMATVDADGSFGKLPLPVSSSLNGKYGVFLGDSITELDWFQNTIVGRGNITYANDAVGGSTITRGYENSVGDGTTRISFFERSQTAFGGSPQFIFMLGGINDWAHNVPLGSITDTTTTTFYGAVRGTLLNLIVNNPNALIACGTMLQSNGVPYGGSVGGRDNYAQQKQYADAVKEVAATLSVPCLDLFASSGFTYENLGVLTSDGTHPSQFVGMPKLGNLIYDFLNNPYSSSSSSLVASTGTLQTVTDAGNITSNAIISQGSGVRQNSSNTIDADLFVELSAAGATDKFARLFSSAGNDLVLGVDNAEGLRIKHGSRSIQAVSLAGTGTRPVVTDASGNISAGTPTDLSGYLTNITGLVTAGTNVTVTGSGTSGSPYVVGATVPTTYWTTGGKTNDIKNTNTASVNIGLGASNTNWVNRDYFNSKLRILGGGITIDSISISGQAYHEITNLDTAGKSSLVLSNGDFNCNSCRATAISMFGRTGNISHLYPNQLLIDSYGTVFKHGGSDYDLYVPSSISPSGDTIIRVGLNRDFEIKGSNHKFIIHSPDGTAHNITVTNTPAIALDGVEVTGTGGGVGSGTVTSVSLTTPSWLSVSGSPVTSSGTLAVTAATGQTANQFLATPNGSTGAVGLRSIVAADLPTLNQSTTGSAGSVTNALTIGAELSSTGATSYNGSAVKTIGIQSASVTNTMLAGSIAASKLVGSDIATVGTVTAGTWNGTAITGTYGGTGVNNGTKTITLGGNLTTSGAFATTLTATATTSVTLPTSGTLATRAGTETFTNKDLSSGTNTFPTTLATLTGTQTLTSKTLTSPAYTSQALTDGATVTWNAANGTVATVTLAGNRTLSITNPVTNAYYMIKIKQDGTGSRTLTFPTIKWKGGTAPTLTTTANAEDIITLFYDGTSYYGNWGADYK